MGAARGRARSALRAHPGAPHAQVGLRHRTARGAEVELRTPAAALESLQRTRIGPREILRHRDGIAINDAVPRIADLLGLLDRERPPAPGSSAFAQTLQRLQGQAGSALPHA
jgi:hypothetical protein